LFDVLTFANKQYDFVDHTSCKQSMEQNPHSNEN